MNRANITTACRVLVLAGLLPQLACGPSSGAQQALETGNPGPLLTEEGIELSSVLALQKALRSEDEYVVRAAATQLGTMGPKAHAAIPDLFGWLVLESEKDYRKQRNDAAKAVTDSLAKMGSAAAVVCAEGLPDALSIGGLPVQLLFVLRDIGPEAAVAVPILLTLTHEFGVEMTVQDVSKETLEAILAEIGPETEYAVEHLISALQVALADQKRYEGHPDAEKALVGVIDAVGRMGPTAVVATIELEKLLQSENEKISSAAKEALQQFSEGLQTPP